MVCYSKYARFHNGTGHISELAVSISKYRGSLMCLSKICLNVFVLVSCTLKFARKVYMKSNFVIGTLDVTIFLTH